MGPSSADDAGAGPTWAVGYRRGPAAVDVCGNHPADLDYLCEFLEPWCEVVPAGGAALRVRMVAAPPVAARLAAAWRELAPTAQRVAPIPCVKLDGQAIAFAGWREEGVLRLVDPVTGCFFVLGEGAVDVVCREGDDSTRLGLLGLVREAITGAVAAAAPIVDLHAAAFAAGDRAVVVAGAKGAGKTSLLCHAIVSGGAALIANDRTFVELDQPRPVARGVPTVVSIRADTLKAFPQLGSRADDYPALKPIVVPAPPGAAAAPDRPSDRVLLLTPARFAGRLGAWRVGSAPLSAIVLPEVSPGVSGWRLEQLEPAPAVAALESCRYGMAAVRDAATLFGGLALPAAPRPAPIGTRLARLVASVPVFSCRIGPDARCMPIQPLFDALGLRGAR